MRMHWTHSPSSIDRNSTLEKSIPFFRAASETTQSKSSTDTKPGRRIAEMNLKSALRA